MNGHGERKISFNNPVWQFLSCVIAAFSFLLYSYSIYDALIINRSQKSLKIDIAHCNTVIPLKGPTPKGFEIFYDGKKIDEASVIGVRILNIGNIPIVPNDYEKPINIKLPPTVKILSASVDSVHPKDLKPKITLINESEISIGPLLLNPLDNFEIDILAINIPDSIADEISITGRINGIKELSIFKEGLGEYLLGVINNTYHTEAIIVIPIAMVIVFIFLWFVPKCWFYIEQIFGKQPSAKWPRFSLNMFLAAIAAIVLEDIVEGIIEIIKTIS